MKIWAGYSDVDVAVKTIATSMKEVGMIPEVLVRAYWESIEKSSRGIVQRFYEKLTAQCPEALRYFAQKPVELELEEKGL